MISTSNYATFMFERGNLKSAELYARKALDAFERICGHDDQNTLTAVNNYAKLMSEMGYLAESEQYSSDNFFGRNRHLV